MVTEPLMVGSQTSVIAVVWLDRDDKTYYYGPFTGANELHLGYLFLNDLWNDHIEAGRVGLYHHDVSPPPWLREATPTVAYGTRSRPWLKTTIDGHQTLQGFPILCEDRPVVGKSGCKQYAGHIGDHEPEAVNEPGTDDRPDHRDGRTA